MKDLHNHILFGIDDGSRNLEESIKIIEEAERNGYTDLILTPHYRKLENFTSDNKSKRKRFKDLKKAVEERNIGVNIYLGNEITLDEDFFYYLRTNQLSSLNDSKYLLLELPFIGKLDCLDEIVEDLIENDLIPIIAHPERYIDYTLDDYQKLINKGVLFQGNIGTLFNKYGTKTKTKLEEMLKKHMIHFISSDTHHEGQTSFSRIDRAVEKIELLTGSKEMALELVDGNISKVINNEDIKAYKVRQKKHGLKLFKIFK